MGRLKELLPPNQVVLELKSSEHRAALEEVANLLKNAPGMGDFSGFYAQLLERDRLDTTCLGNGLAIPHARTEHVAKIVMAVGRSLEGVPFDQNGERVRLLFVLGTPVDKPMEYLKLVSLLCKILKVDTNRAALLAAGNTDDFLRVLADAEDRLVAPIAR